MGPHKRGFTRPTGSSSFGCGDRLVPSFPFEDPFLDPGMVFWIPEWYFFCLGFGSESSLRGVPKGNRQRKHVPRIFIGLRPQTCLRHAHSPGLHWSSNGRPGRPTPAEPMQPRRPNPSVIPYSGNEVFKGNRQRKHVPRIFSGSVCASLLK